MGRQAALGQQAIGVRQRIASCLTDRARAGAFEVHRDRGLAAQELCAPRVRQGSFVDGGPIVDIQIARTRSPEKPIARPDTLPLRHGTSDESPRKNLLFSLKQAILKSVRVGRCPAQQLLPCIRAQRVEACLAVDGRTCTTTSVYRLMHSFCG